MKKIFVLTGEPSGDKLASTVIDKLQQNHSDIEYLSVGGSHLNSLGIKSIYDLKEVTYIGFTSVILNLFKIFPSLFSKGSGEIKLFCYWVQTDNPKTTFKKGLEQTFKWYLENKMYYKSLSKKDIINRLGNKK